MPIQDLTPQLRTRLNRVERIVGLFILAATLLMLGGLVYYISQTARERGWFKLKAPYYTYLRSGSGIKVGDKVMMMGSACGEIADVRFMPPDSLENVYVEFHMVGGENVGYVWSDSTVSVKSKGLLGDRYLEVSKGDFSGRHGRVFETYKITNNLITQVLTDTNTGAYGPWDARARKAYPLRADEPPELATQMDAIVQKAQDALPFVLALTNTLTRVMDNTAQATERVNGLLLQAEPVVANLAVISENLKRPRGALGEWLMPTNTQVELDRALAGAGETLRSANLALTNVNVQITEVAVSLDAALDNLGRITGSLRQQVEGNTNVVAEVSRLIVNTDDLVQGLKKHWLLRSAFKGTNGKPGGDPGGGDSKPLRPRGTRRQE